MNSLSNAEIIKLFVKNTLTVKRTNAVGIKWYTLYNKQLINLGISPNTLENWSDMFTLTENDKEFKEKYYISDIIRMFFGNRNDVQFYGQTERRKASKLFKIQDKMDPEADAIIFTTVGNRIHTLLAELIKSIAGDRYDVAIMDGGSDDRQGTSNSECEELMKAKSEEARHNGKRMIFIASGMGNRSWSNKYAKNIILMFNKGTFDTNSQKIARGWTPWEAHETCSVFDFRLSYDYPTIAEEYLSNTLINKSKYSAEDINEVLGTIASSDKIEFIDAYGNENVDDPFKTRDLNEMKSMLLSNNNFNEYRITSNIDLNKISTPEKNIKLPNVSNGIESDNSIGDTTKTIKKSIKENVKNKENKTNEKIDLKVKYIQFIFTNGFLFNRNHYSVNILNNILNEIDDYKEMIEDEETLNMSFNTVKDILNQFKNIQIEIDGKYEMDKFFMWK